MRKFLLLFFFILALFGLYVLYQEKTLIDTPVPVGEIQIHMLDIGQGDSVLIQGNGKNILVDTGPPSAKQKLLDKLKKYKVEKVDLLIITHAHSDHNGNVLAILNTLPVDLVMESPALTASPIVKKYYSLMKEKKIPLKIPKAGEFYEISEGANLEFLTPLGSFEDPENVNNSSLVFILSSGKIKALFTGDAESQVEKELIRLYGNKLESQILKSPHHGSRTSSSDLFIKTVHPQVALISLGAGNDYGHPHKEVLKRYQKYGVSDYRTDIGGDISVYIKDGQYQVATEKKGR